MSRSKISQHGRKLQIRRETDTRQNTSVTWPLRSSNGSTITLNATDDGLRISWIGGRSLYGASDEEPSSNGRQHSPDNTSAYSQRAQPDDEAFYESDDEDSDDEARHANVVQEIQLRLGGPVHDLAIAPPLPSPPQGRDPALYNAVTSTQSRITLVVTCDDGSAKVVCLPLDPPSMATKRKRRYGAQICSLDTGPAGMAPRGVTLAWDISKQTDADPRPERPRTRHSTHRPSGPLSLIVAFATSELAGRIHFFHVPITNHEDTPQLAADEVQAFQSIYLKALPTAIAFSTAPPHLPQRSQLLLADISGFTSVFDLFPDSESHNTTDTLADSTTIPQWLVHYSTSFSFDSEGSPYALAHRQKVLTATWVLDGTAALVLLEDGTFGLYAVSAIPPTSSQTTLYPLSFAFSAFIGDAPEHAALPATSTSTLKPKRAHLAPMTPKTRRTKSENLFSGPPAGSYGAARGGISTIATTTANGSPDNAVVLWYGKRLFAMPSLVAYWTRSTSRETGSLYGTGLTALDEVDLSGEIVTAVNILHPREISDEPQVLGSAAWKYDVQVSGEYKTVVLTAARHKAARRPVEERDEVEGSPTSRADVRALRKGELGLDGMDRMLDGMTGVEPTGRRVGFRD